MGRQSLASPLRQLTLSLILTLGPSIVSCSPHPPAVATTANLHAASAAPGAAPTADAPASDGEDQVPPPAGSGRQPGLLACEPRPPLPDVARPIHPDGGGLWGSSDKEVIRQVIRRHLVEVKTCYGARMGDPPYKQGKVMARLAIAGSGKVRFSCLASSTMDEPDIDRCIVDAVLKWEFPKVPGGGWLVVDYPFVLMPAPNQPSSPSSDDGAHPGGG